MTLGLFFLFFFQLPIQADEPKSEQPAPPADIARINEDVKKALGRMLEEEDIMMTVGLHTPWHIVHGALAYGDKLKLRDPQSKKLISALDWIRNGGIWREQPSFLTSPSGFRGNPYGPQFQGHMAQFGGYLSELRLEWSTPFNAWNQEKQAWETRPLSALYEEIKQTVTIQEPQGEDNESSWALWALARSGYAKVDETWNNTAGETISFERLVHVETLRDLEDAACGGLHGLFAMSLALKLYKATGKELKDSWIIADYLEQKYIRQAKKQQNEDGSFSSEYFYGPGEGKNWRESLPGSGHILEWLMLVLPDEDLKSDWVLKGVHSVAKNILAAELGDHDVENYLGSLDSADITEEKQDELFEHYMTLGGYFHAAHGLKMFQDRAAKLP